MKHLASAIFLACSLTACETTSTPGSAGSASGSGKSGMGIVAGTWRFSHFGPPTVMNDRVPNPGEQLREHLSATTIAIEESGRTSVVAPGHAASYRASVLEETPLYLKIGAEGQPLEEAIAYDKSTRLMMMPSKLTINGERGILPTYFKRRR